MNAVHYSASIPGPALFACLVLIAACGESPTQLPTADVAPQLAKNGEKGKPKPEDPPGDPDYSILDVGAIEQVYLADIINSGLMVGGVDGRPALFNASGQWLQFGDEGLHGVDLSEMGYFAVGTNINNSGLEERIPFRWTLSGTGELEDPTATQIELLKLEGALYANVRAVNDLGQAAGDHYFFPDDTGYQARTAAIWEVDGTIITLPHLPESDRAWPRAINNSGHVVGASYFSGASTEAVLWIEIDGAYTVVDLGGDAYSGQAVWVSDVSDGSIMVAGYSMDTESGEFANTFWTVNVVGSESDPLAIPLDIEVKARVPHELCLRDVNASGDVVCNGELVWNWLGGSSSTLPGFDDRCGEPRGTHINDAGTVVGYRQVFVSTGKGKSRGYCTNQAVMWTKNQ